MSTYFTRKELAECAHREIGQRKRVYDNLVRAKKMKLSDSTREIQMMEEIYRLLVRVPDEVFSRILENQDI